MLTRKYKFFRLAGCARPYCPPGKLVHAIEFEDGRALSEGMAICSRTPRPGSRFEPVVAPNGVTCPRCKERMR